MHTIRVTERTERLGTSPHVLNLEEGYVKRRWGGVDVADSLHRQSSTGGHKVSTRTRQSPEPGWRLSFQHSLQSHPRTHFRGCANERAKGTSLKRVITTGRSQQHVHNLDNLLQRVDRIHTGSILVLVGALSGSWFVRVGTE